MMEMRKIDIAKIEAALRGWAGAAPRRRGGGYPLNVRPPSPRAPVATDQFDWTFRRPRQSLKNTAGSFP